VIFNLCLAIGYVPELFSVGSLFLLLKNNSLDATVSGNYRGITLSCVMSKIFEKCLLLLFEGFLKSDDLQFGFKKHVGCRDAILTVRTAINFYTNRGSTVSACLLDLSKAFDTVNYNGLLLKLMDRNVPRSFINIILSWYFRSKAFVRWGDVLSDCFRLNAGVRQGGILSPYLFAIYIDVLIAELRLAGRGLKIYGKFLGCFLYADDIMIAASSLHELQLMLDICHKVITSLDMRVNSKKSYVIRFGKSFKSSCANVLLGGVPMPVVDSVKYLGVTFKSGLNVVLDTKNAKMSFYKAFNAMFSKCGHASSELVACHLLQSVCIPILWYALEASNLKLCVIRELDNAIINAVRKIFSIADLKAVEEIRVFTGIDRLCDLYAVRKYKFYSQMCTGTCVAR
jgi:hypothetical protein